MASCSSFQKIFDTPTISEPKNTSKFINSLTSPWKQPNPSSGHNNEHLSSFTEIFGELHFKESSETKKTWSILDIKNTKKVEKQWYPVSDMPRKNQESFELCTEGLGSESFADVEEEMDNGEVVVQVERQEPRERVAKLASMGSLNDEVKKVKKSFPPPISCIGKSGKPWVSFKSYREDGRFVLKEVKIPTQEFLHARREDGRLRLHFARQEEEEEEGTEDMQKEDEDVEEDGEAEEEYQGEKSKVE